MSLKRSPYSSRNATRSSAQNFTVAVYLAVTFAVGVFLILFFSGRLVLFGVPSSILVSFLQDDIARTAYIAGDSKLLHDRLDDMGVETQMKDFYRPQFSDEGKLDQHIHQILYDRTGYVGEAYEVNPQGTLVPKK